ncbi:MAG: hypothetical protein FWF36_04630 [Propionibacteriaceae bacterium]|nr:hypothetical protein [Propionibacteriaceae bacterium]
MQVDLPDVFTAAQALAAGLSRNQLRGNRYRPVCRGVYTTGNPSDLMVRAKAALLVAGPETLLGGVTVLCMCGVWLPQKLLDDTRIHVVLPVGRRGPEMAFIKAVRSPVSLQPIWLGDVLGVHPAQAWLQVATQLSEIDLTVAADSLMRRKSTLATRGEIETELARRWGTRGVALARRALEKARAGVESPMETRLRLALVAAGLDCPVVDFPFQPLPRGKEYRLDMAYPAQRLAVEYDGGVHADAVRMRDDRTRRRLLEDAGWRIITATAADLPGFESVIASVRRALSSSRPK